MTMRSIDSRFWADGWVRKLNALDRYLFLYLLTNDHTTWCGVYELDIAMMAFESGIDREDLERAMLPRLSPKAVYVDGWVYVPNWMKYHLSSSGTVSPQHKKGFDAAWKTVPERIRLKIKEIGCEVYPMVGVSPSTSTSTSIPANAEEKDIPIGYDERPAKTSKAKYPNALTVFSWFPNPQKSWESMKNVQEREYAEYLFSRGEEAVKQALRYLDAHSGEEFLPKVTKPSDLERKWEDLKLYAKRNG